jgi:6,7-dimethyl-8-ribityllumazine synthase
VRYAIVVGRFYEDLAERLVASATRTFELAGAEAVDVFDVPGAYELPFAAQELAKTGRYAGVACLGAVIRGETSHYDHVCEESARGIMDVAPAAASGTPASTPRRPYWRSSTCARR